MIARRVRHPALALLAFALALPWCGEARAQVSPGPLARAHESLDGALSCLQCHGPGGSKSGMDDKCLACHKEVAWMRTAKRGLHARVLQKNCASCHPDHGGRAFELIVWDEGAPERFNHDRTGFTLEGKHAQLECAKCHTPALQKSPAAALIKRKDRAKSWMGLQTACADCHADVHRGQLGRACADCHAQLAWKPAPGFDHAKSRYPLTGAHAKVECMKCHQAPQFVKQRDAAGQPLAEWKPLPHGDCVSCHKDPHAGRFKGACAKCHVTEDFHTVRREGFDHDQTRYPLRGKHAAVDCARCHDERKAWGKTPKFARCGDCHQDPHAGRATIAGKPADCEACHGVAGFHPSTFSVAAHQRSAYPLEGRHAAADCSGCHAKRADEPKNVTALGRALVEIRPAHGACVDCHGDPHEGRFRAPSPRARKDDCLACHGMSGFRPTKYDSRMHFECEFKLEGAHLAVPCQACHEELKAPPAESTLRSQRQRRLTFESPKRACVDCHENVHGSQFAYRKDKGACQGCHGNDSFAPAARFSHDRDSRFKLEGAHKSTPCSGCHERKPDASGKTMVIYRPTPTQCEACHAGGVQDSLAVPKSKSKTSFVPPRRESRGLVLLTTREADRGTVH